MIYDQNFNISFQRKMETTQYHAPLAITDAIRSYSTEKLYQELGLETLQQRRSMFLQNTKITFSKVPLFNNFHSQYVIENKAI